MISSRMLLLALVGPSLLACRRHILSDDQPEAAVVAPPAAVTVAVAPAASEKPSQAVETAARGDQDPAQLTIIPATLPPTMPVGTIEMSDFKPIKEDLTHITKIKADKIRTDASGKMTLRGNVLVEIKQGVAVSRLMSDEISIQTGPGFHPEVNGQK